MVNRLNDAQAKAIAYSFISEIPKFIEQNKQKYLEYLDATGQTDEYYQSKNTEADK